MHDNELEENKFGMSPALKAMPYVKEWVKVMAKQQIKHKHKWCIRRISFNCCDLRPGAINWLIADRDVEVCFICDKVRDIKRKDSKNVR